MSAPQAKPSARIRAAARRPGPAPKRTRRPLSFGAHLALCLAVLAIALGMRLHELGDESLWVDEAITHGRATKPPDALIQDTLGRKHIPTYFLFMHHWLQVGDSEAALRLPSALFGAATCGLTYAIGALAAGPIAGLTGGLLMAAAPAQLRYAQEARMYALLTMAAALALLGLMLLVRAPLERGRAPFRLSWAIAPERRAAVGWLCLMLGTIAILWTHNTAVFFVAALQVAGLAVWVASPGRRLGFFGNWVAVMAACLAAWSPWIPHLIDQSGSFDRWKQRPLTLERATDVLDQLLLVGDLDRPLAWLLCSAMVLALVMRGRLHGRGRLAACVLACAAVAGLGLSIAASLLKANMFFVRTLLWTAIPAYALVGVGVARLPRGTGPVGLALALVLIAPETKGYFEATHRSAWRDYLVELAEETDKNDIIVGVRITRFTFYYYNRRDGRLPPLKMRHVGRQKRLEDLVGDAERFWVLAKRSAGRMNHFRYLLRKSDGRYRLVSQKRSRDALLMKYALEREPEPRRPMREAILERLRGDQDKQDKEKPDAK